jgi:ribonuclease HI
MEIYTDGSCRGNPGRGGWAAIILDPTLKKPLVASTSGHDPGPTTNNRMELQAAIEGLTKFTQLNGQKPIPINGIPVDVNVVSDSMYLVNGMNLWLTEWKNRRFSKVKNAGMWINLDRLSNDLTTQGFNITWRWVKAHSGDKYNNIVDVMASKASKQRVE